MQIEGKDTQISLQGCHSPPTTTYIRANTKEKRNWEISPKNAGYASCDNRRSRTPIDDLNGQDVVLCVVNQLWKFQNDPTVGSLASWNFVSLSRKTSNPFLSQTLSLFLFFLSQNKKPSPNISCPRLLEEVNKAQNIWATHQWAGPLTLATWGKMLYHHLGS